MSKPSSHTVYRKPYFSGGANLDSGDLGTAYWPVPHYVTWASHIISLWLFRCLHGKLLITF